MKERKIEEKRKRERKNFKCLFTLPVNMFSIGTYPIYLSLFLFVSVSLFFIKSSFEFLSQTG
jgi:hypothetical protein